MNLELQEQVESNGLGRAIISGIILFVLIVMLGANLPTSSPIKDQIERIVQPARNLVGLDQYWGVFAPDPRMESWGIRAEITYDDGAVGRWSTPQGDAFIGAYRFYRWNKYAEQIFLEDRRHIWPDLAIWLVRIHDRPDRHPVRIVLIRRWQALNPPGSEVTHGAWQEKTFYILPVTPQVLRAATAR